MSENINEHPDFDEFDENSDSFSDDDDEEGYEPEEIPIYPQQSVIFPWENMTLRITDPITLQMFDDAKIEEEKVVGITYQRDGSSGLPPVGSLGVAVYVFELTKTNTSLHFAKVTGVVRYTIEEYVETDKPYPVARVNYFDDDYDENAEAFKAKLVGDLKAILQKMIDNSPTAKNRVYIGGDLFTPDKAEMYSFIFWWWHKLNSDTRLFFLGLRSTYQRLACLNDALTKGLEDSKNKKRGSNN